MPNCIKDCCGIGCRGLFKKLGPAGVRIEERRHVVELSVDLHHDASCRLPCLRHPCRTEAEEVGSPRLICYGALRRWHYPTEDGLEQNRVPCMEQCPPQVVIGGRLSESAAHTRDGENELCGLEVLQHEEKQFARQPHQARGRLAIGRSGCRRGGPGGGGHGALGVRQMPGGRRKRAEGTASYTSTSTTDSLGHSLE
eukprot:scaffold42570_cov31-Tisochrysis_lutea.AAC.1